MRLADVTVVVNALRPDAPDHERCRTWLEDTVNDRRPHALTGVVLSGVVRVLTHPRIFRPPSSTDDVLARLEPILAAENAVRVEPGSRHWAIFTDLCRTGNAAGNLVPDAWLAAVAIEHGCNLVTLDRDFARFPGLDHTTP